ncbi:MAG: tetratricopeptide repeat protein [Alsobacter sp.]
MRRLNVIQAMILAASLTLAAAPALAVGPWTSPLENEPDYREAEALIKAGEWTRALPPLDRLVKQHPKAPEVLNYLGFVHRKLKDYPTSKRFYDAALQVKSDYLPALEYQGEWYLETGDLAAAKANLQRLEQLCGQCHEWNDLAESIRKVAPDALPK